MKLPTLPARPLYSGENTADPTDLQTTFGDEPAMVVGKNRRIPDRRRVSARWMLGSVLTGVTSVLLMGGALYAALDGRQQLAQPANTLDELVNQFGNSRLVVKGDRPSTVVALKPVKEQILQVPTVTRVGNSNVIRKKPFAYASAPLGVAEQPGVKYPAFNPLTIFRASRADTKVVSNDVIYGAEIEGEVRIETLPFPLDGAVSVLPTVLQSAEAETILRKQLEELEDGATRSSAVAYLNDSHLSPQQQQLLPVKKLEMKITAENVSTAMQNTRDEAVGHTFFENVITTVEEQSLTSALSGLGMEKTSLNAMVQALEKQLGTEPMKPGTKLRISWEQRINISASGGKQKVCRRISVYEKGNHIKSIALNDEGVIVWGTEPAPIPAVANDPGAFEEDAIAMVPTSKLPNIYDGIYRAALSQNLNVDQARQIVRIVAFNVDFRSKIKLSDDLEVFYSLEEGQTVATDKSEILYVGLTLSGKKGKYYRFVSGKKGKVDYYNAKGKSSKKFLLRKPVP